MLTTFYPPFSFGGDALFVEALSRGLVGRGHEVEVVHCVDSYRALAPRDGPSAAAGSGEIITHALRSPWGRLSPLATQQTGRPLLKSARIRRILAAKPFDVLHFHNVSLLGGPALLSYGSALKLYTIHEHWLLCPMHTLFRDNREPCTEKRCIRCSLHYRRPPQLWRYGRLLERSVAAVDRFLAPTEFTRRLHLASGLPLRMSVLGHFHQPLEPGPDHAEEALDARQVRVAARPFFLYAGRLERLKGVADLIDAFRAASANGVPGAADSPLIPLTPLLPLNTELLIAGSGSAATELRERAAGCGAIRFLGPLSRHQLAGLYPRALAVVVPSLGHEVFPLVLLEAWAAGAAVLARDHGALGEIVRTSGGGLLFGDPEGLRAGLARLAADERLRKSLGQAGQAAWQARWTLDTHLDRYLALVAELRSQRGTGGA